MTGRCMMVNWGSFSHYALSRDIGNTNVSPLEEKFFPREASSKERCNRSSREASGKRCSGPLSFVVGERDMEVPLDWKYEVRLHCETVVGLVVGPMGCEADGWTESWQPSLGVAVPHPIIEDVHKIVEIGPSSMLLVQFGIFLPKICREVRNAVVENFRDEVAFFQLGLLSDAHGGYFDLL